MGRFLRLVSLNHREEIMGRAKTPRRLVLIVEDDDELRAHRRLVRG